MKKIVYNCDGCDAPFETPGLDAKSVPSDLKLDVTVIINAMTNKFDLCDPCYNRLLKDANPSSWVRKVKGPFPIQRVGDKTDG